MIVIRVTMRDGSLWDVPALVVAENRAKYYAARDEDTTYEEELSYTLSDHYELMDWAANNMNWEDVAELAVKVKDPAPLTQDDFQNGWVNGPKQVIVFGEDLGETSQPV